MSSIVTKSSDKRKPRKRPDIVPRDSKQSSQQNRRPRIDPAAVLSMADCFAVDDSPQSKHASKSTAMSTVNESDRKKLLAGIHKDDVGNGRNRGTHIPKWTLRIIANSTDAIVFAQLAYWLERGHGPQPSRGLNYRWVAKSAGELVDELHRTRNEVDHSLQRLRKRGLITWTAKKFAGVKQRHISIMWANVQVAYQRVASKISVTAH